MKKRCVTLVALVLLIGVAPGPSAVAATTSPPAGSTAKAPAPSFICRIFPVLC